MEHKEIEQLIRFHQAGLDQYRKYMEPSAQYLEGQTINALKELDKRLATEEEGARAIKIAKAILVKKEAE